MLFIHLFVFFCAIWVMTDATKNGITLPSRWGFGTVALWFIVFPAYLFKRKRLIKEAQQLSSTSEPDVNVWTKDKKEPSKFVSYLVIFAIAAGSYTYWLSKGELPSCSSAEVAGVLDKLVNGAPYSKQAQESYETISEIRHCNMMVYEQIVTYTVSWYSEKKDQIIVRLGR